MYKLSGKLKLFSIVLMVIGLVGLTYGFLNTPATVDDVKEILATQNSHHEGEPAISVDASQKEEFVDQARGEEGYAETAIEHYEKEQDQAHGNHLKHVLHQLQTKPWSATLVSAFFFFMIALGVLVFYAIQFVAHAGWSPVLFRVMEGITTYLLPGSVIVVLLVLLAGTHFYPWQNEELVSEDKILQGKSMFLNFPSFAFRAIIYLLGWNLYRYFSRKYSLLQETAEDLKSYRKTYKMSAFFLIFFIITEATMSWDWFMSMTPHWYSTLYAWYIFASMFVSAITVIALVVIYLKSKGLADFINDSHLHDLAKYMFAFSIFWTYLWFDQFMLIWYANMPEEAVYFVIRIQEYNLLFFGMLVLNFVFPILILMNSDFKRVPWFVVFAGIAILIGHYIDIYLLVMPSTVGLNWSFGITEIASISFFLGLFIFVVGTGLTKVNLHPKGNPLIEESEHFHY